MPARQRILVTGVAGAWGSRVAARLLQDVDRHVLGLDRRPPQRRLDGLDFIQADLRDPLLAALLRDEQIAAVCHLPAVDEPGLDGANGDTLVTGTIDLLAACAAAEIRQIVVMSSSLVYGARPTNPAFMAEDQPLYGAEAPSVRRLTDIEAAVAGSSRRPASTRLAVLRFAHILGPTAPSPLNRLLRLPLSPVLLGFDPLLQVIHEDDVEAALLYALEHGADGPFNIAAEGLLPLSRLLALGRKPALPLFHPLAYAGARWLGGTRLATYLPLDPDYLRYRCVADLTRLHEVLGFEPERTAEAVARAARRERPDPAGEPDPAAGEAVLGPILARRRLARVGRERQGQGRPATEEATHG